MSLEPPNSVAPALVFNWEVGQQSRWSRRLLWLLLFSLGGHVASFYLLQVLYTAPAALPPKAVQITLPNPNSAEGAALAQWLLVADPALAVSAVEPTAAAVLARLPARGYTAAVSNQDFAVSAPEFTNDPAPSDGLDLNPAAVTVRPVSPAGRPRESVSIARRNAIQLAASLQARVPAERALPTVEVIAPTAVSTNPPQPLQPAVFLLGVRAEGGAPLVFQRVGSGRAAADEAARNALSQLLFVPAATGTTNAENPAPILWGEAQVQWGREAYP